jgi:hypothetical protein
MTRAAKEIHACIGELNKSTRVKVAVGMNAFLEQPDQTNHFKLLIDSSSLSGEDEARALMVLACALILGPSPPLIILLRDTTSK